MNGKIEAKEVACHWCGKERPVEEMMEEADCYYCRDDVCREFENEEKAASYDLLLLRFNRLRKGAEKVFAELNRDGDPNYKVRHARGRLNALLERTKE